MTDREIVEFVAERIASIAEDLEVELTYRTTRPSSNTLILWIHDLRNLDAQLREIASRIT